MKKALLFFGCIIMTLLTGGISGLLSAGEIRTWYATLHKPSFNPPNWVFGPVWTGLYLLMGISLFIVLQANVKNKRNAVTLFFVQLVLNFCWSLIFFNFHLIGAAFVEILLLWTFILLMIIRFYKINRTAALLQLPYLAWVSFASVLNFSIWMLN